MSCVFYIFIQLYDSFYEVPTIRYIEYRHLIAISELITSLNVLLSYLTVKLIEIILNGLNNVVPLFKVMAWACIKVDTQYLYYMHT